MSYNHDDLETVGSYSKERDFPTQIGVIYSTYFNYCQPQLSSGDILLHYNTSDWAITTIVCTPKV